MEARPISFQEWSHVAEDAHMATFGEERPKDFNTFDYCIGAFNNEEMCGYATVIEMDKTWAYMQHGGAFPNISKSSKVIKAYKEILNLLRDNYSIISTKIENENLPMLKLALANGFLINGVDYISNKVIVHLMMEVQ